ncbi:MAG: hypothetical protein QG564_185 [Campylobacterota bacterium]|nr:hypothetical protein [Campylobacterota bacterium]
MVNKNKTLVSRIFFMGMIFVLGVAGASAKNISKDTDIVLVKEKFIKSDQDTDSHIDTAKAVIGAVEKVRVIPGNFVMKARIDTGASITSIGIDNVEIVNEDGEDWAIVTLDDVTVKHKVVKYIYVKRHGAKSHKRPVIKLRLTLGEKSKNVNVSLADRGNFQYQLLIGRNFLNDRFVVDVSLKNTISPVEYKEN